MDYIHLQGSEEVSRAGHNMESAAERMVQASNNITYALNQHENFMNDFLVRLEEILKKGE